VLWTAWEAHQTEAPVAALQLHVLIAHALAAYPMLFLLLLAVLVVLMKHAPSLSYVGPHTAAHIETQ